jgi:ParB family chromosome partitioning protein
MDNVKMLRIDDLVPFENHPFNTYEDKRYDEMVESIKQSGIITPLAVRVKGDKFEIMAGHNRAKAAKGAGLEEVLCRVYENLSDEQATRIVFESNFNQQDFNSRKYSERAKAIKLYHDIWKRQGARTDLDDDGTLGHGVLKSTTRLKLGQQFDLNERTVTRYIQVSALIQPLLDRLDSGQIKFIAATSLAVLDEDEQNLLNEVICDGFEIGGKQATAVKHAKNKLGEDKTLTKNAIEEALLYQKEPKLKASVVFTNLSEKCKENGIDEARISEAIAEALERLLEENNANYEQ